MEDIFVGAIPPTLNSQNKRENTLRPSRKRKSLKEKRRSKRDRRKDARSGVVVTLTKYPDRRSGVDRRKNRTSG